jgi:manganese/zinc/iron transport system permease protein
VGEDAAIGAVLSVFFGLGIVLLTVIQTMSQGKAGGTRQLPAWIDLRNAGREAVLIAAAGGVAVALVVRCDGR